MQADYPAAFAREVACTEADWLGSLPGAVRGRELSLAPGRARLRIGDGGALELAWRVLAPRQIALLRVPRLAVDFRFEGLDDAARGEFMRYFDLYMQRGGG